jgi:lipid II:glycine glycyltransferase (peptidoglycan interpeptide bridge formation enzyme)
MLTNVTDNANSIFQQPWWLDALAPNQWDEVTVEKNGEVIARLPYMVKKKYGLTILSKPPLTQTTGPWLKPSQAKYTNQLSEQKELMQELIEKLPPYDYFLSTFHYSVTNWLPFFWKGFSQRTAYTYVLEDLGDLDVVWKGFRENIRREIRKAEKKVKVRNDLGVDRFIQINEMTYQRQGQSFPYPVQVIRDLDAACVRQNARQIFFAEDADGQIHAAIYVVWDKNSAYYLMGGGDPELRSSGATSLLMWEAIKFAATVTNKFDFEGSMIEPVERFFRAFGAVQKPYFVVERSGTQRMKLLLSIQDLAKSIGGK